MERSVGSKISIIINDWRILGRISIQQLNIEAGEFLHVLGPNGAGKSTLLESIAGLLASDSGQIMMLDRSLDDWSLPELAHQRGYLGQQLACQFELLVTDIIGFFSEQNVLPDKVEKALEIAELMSLPLNQLSGGQQQRVHIARALLQVWPSIVLGKAILVLDEPLQRLDIAHQQSCLDLLQYIVSMGNTVVMSSHDINLSHQFASSIALLKSGKLISAGSPKQVLNVKTLKLAFGCDFNLVYSENAYEFFHPRVNS